MERYSTKKDWNMTKEEIKKFNEENYEYFDVPGAGKIQIGKEPSAITGGAEGFGFGVEWGQYGYSGGVIDKKEAVRLARHILRSVNLSELDI
jgi:hypothetical protein